MTSLSQKADRIQESQTIAISSLAKKLRAEGKNVISLSAGEPDFPTPEHIKKAAIKAIQDNFTKYTQNEGTPQLREAVAEKFRNDNGMNVKASNILVSNGGKHSLFNALQAICNPGDEVIIPAPYWVSFPEMVKLADAVPVVLQTKEEKGFTFDAGDVEPLVTPKTKAIIVNTPSNPTGAVIGEEALRGIAALAVRKGFFIISDEIYEKIIYDDNRHFSVASIPEASELVITSSGVSKAYSMTGWRIGFIAAREDIIKRAAKMQSQETSNASSISQAAALEALRGPQDDVAKMRLAFEKRRNVMLEKLRSIDGFTVNKPGGAFYFFPSVKGLFGRTYNGKQMSGSLDIAQFFLSEAQVALVPGIAFGSDGHMRMSYAYSEKELTEAADRIASAVAKLK